MGGEGKGLLRGCEMMGKLSHNYQIVIDELPSIFVYSGNYVLQL